MKHIRKIFTMMLAVMLLMTLFITVSADDTTYTITINGANPGHEYVAYQIFTGDLHDGVLSNLRWGDGQATYKDEEPNNINDTRTPWDANAMAGTLTSANVVDWVKNTLTLQNPRAFSYDATAKVYTCSNLPAGYYLVKDNNEGELSLEYAAYTDYILQVVGNVTQATKSSVPSIEKKVHDINDTTQSTVATNEDSADYDIGDHVPFHIHVKLNNHLTSYSTYKLVIKDTMSKGLTYDENSMVITLAGADVPASAYTFEKTKNETTGETNLTITFANIKTLNPASYANLIINYTATLNNDAVIGGNGNPNKVVMQFSNNPEKLDEMGQTPEDKVVVFTYKTIVNKVHTVNENTEPLAGAEFTLFKKISGNNTWQSVKILGGDSTTTFEFTGLDDGIYRLVESVTPGGYNTMDPIEFEIKATHDKESEDPKLLTLNCEVLSGSATFNVDASAGTIETEVINHKGATLPTTGGMGTTLFYVVGGIMVLAAVVLLVTKKRMSGKQ